MKVRSGSPTWTGSDQVGGVGHLAESFADLARSLLLVVVVGVTQVTQPARELGPVPWKLTSAMASIEVTKPGQHRHGAVLAGSGHPWLGSLTACLASVSLPSTTSRRGAVPADTGQFQEGSHDSLPRSA